MTSQTVIEKILDIARWAPSGDNTQPWRFEVIDERHVVVHGFDTRDHCVYDLDGHPSQISLGALLENISIAASGYGLEMRYQRRRELPEAKPTFDVHFDAAPDLQADPLIAFIPERSVQRRPLRTRPLSSTEKKLLEAAVGADYSVSWLEGFEQRLKAAKLMFSNAKLRLTLPEAYEVHRNIIEWNCRYSEDRVPDQALGIDPLTARMMSWVMQSWQRVQFFNTYLGGTLAPRIQMDFIPGLACAAHFVIKAKKAPDSIDDYVRAGRAVQRYWLTVTQLGLFMQPEMTPLIFTSYIRHGIPFSKTEGKREEAQKLAEQVKRVLGEDCASFVFMGRIGAGSAPKSRSIRLPLRRLTDVTRSVK
jgi:hypothetical protein